MKLVWFQVQEFQSVKNSGIVQVDDITCLVGKNESGKTALLRALYRLHPNVDTDGVFSVTHDYPRMDVEDYRFSIEEKLRAPAIPIQAGYELDQEELAEIRNLFGEECLKSPMLTVSKNYDNEVVCSLTVDDNKALAYLIDHADFSEEIREAILDAHRPVDPLIAALDEQEETAKEYEYKYVDYTPDSLITVLDEQGWDEEVNRVRAILDTIKTNDLSFYIWDNLLKAHWPKFLYFDEYYQLTGHENIQALMQRESRKQLRPSDHPMLGLVRLARLQLNELLNPNSSVELRNRLEGASNHLTKQVLKYWSQNKHLKMSFDVRPGVYGDPEEMQSGMNIWGGVLDTRRQVTTELGSRSRGFIWFFSFLAWYSEEKRVGGKLILLLDEPGLSLHASAQHDLLRYFEAELVPHHQLIYSTHSPFMVDPYHFERVRMVEDKSMDAEDDAHLENSGTIVFSNILEASPWTLLPLQGALSYQLHQNQPFVEVFKAFTALGNNERKMSQSRDLLDCARSIRPFLADLLGADADNVDRALADLLAQARTGQQVEKQIEDLLDSHESTRTWMVRYLERRKAGLRFGVYEQVPGDGDPSPVEALLYTCPEDDYLWPRRASGQKIPRCPTHNVRLILLKDS